MSLLSPRTRRATGIVLRNSDLASFNRSSSTSEEVARRALKKLAKQHGSPATLDRYVAAPRRVDVSMLPAQWRHRASIKLGRLVTWATREPPFAITLYVDDDRIALGRAACDRVNDVANGTGWRVVVSSGSRHGAAVLRDTNALDEVVRPFATSVEVAAAALVARVKRSN